jgi:hypothetical protein
MKAFRKWFFILGLAWVSYLSAALGGAPANYSGTGLDDRGQPVTGAKDVAGQSTNAAQIQATKGEAVEIAVSTQVTRHPLSNWTVVAQSSANNTKSSVIAVSDADGIARFRLLPGRWIFHASREDRDAQNYTEIEVVKDRSSRGEIGVFPPFQITGTVRDPNGVPVAGAVLSFGPGDPELTRVSDALGHYEVSPQDVFADSLHQQPSYPLLVRSVERNLALNQPIDGTTTHLDLTLQPGVTLVAKVQDPAGKPVPNASAWVMLGKRERHAGLEDRVNFDAQGHLTITAMPASDIYFIGVSANGYSFAAGEVRAPEQPTNRLEFPTIVLKPANLKVAGYVLDVDGWAVPAATVIVSGVGQPSSDMRTDASGHFAFDVCDGPLTISATTRGASGNVQTVGGDTNVSLKLIPPPPNPRIPRGALPVPPASTVHLPIN